MAFGQGLSGLNASAQNLDVIGNNIANSATVGFKASSVAFADVYASSRVGMGVQVAAINQRFTLGNISSTGNSLDLAIDGEKGLFRLVDTSGNVSYTRNGQFQADRNNYIVNSSGQRLTGYIGENSTLLQELKIPVGNIPPKATQNTGLITNLDANASIISITGSPEVLGEVALESGGVTTTYNFRVSSTGGLTWTDAAGATVPAPPDGTYTSGTSTVTLSGGQVVSGALDPTVAYQPAQQARPFSPADPASFTHSLNMNVYDSLGNAHELTQYFVKRAGTTGTESEWDVYYYMDGVPVDAPAGGGPLPMTFDSIGRLTSSNTLMVTVNQPGTAAAPAEPLVIRMDYTGSTQFAGAFTPNFVQDGYATGEYNGLSVSADGAIVANYTNGESQVMGYVALANFNNLNGMQPIGGNAWQETRDSGPPVFGKPGTNSLARLKGQAVEESNVDMSSELVNMIIAQRNYQANAQTIKTQDQILQTLISLR